MKLNIRTGVGISPKGFGIVFVPTNQWGGVGQLNEYVLAEIGISKSRIPDALMLEQGFQQIHDEPSDTLVVFVVTVGDEDSRTLLTRNFSIAIRTVSHIWGKRSIWIPLMGTGSGGLGAQLSFDIISEEITRVIPDREAPVEIVISIPPNIPDDKISYIKKSVYEISTEDFTPLESGDKELTSLKKSNIKSTLLRTFHDISELVDIVNKELGAFCDQFGETRKKLTGNKRGPTRGILFKHVDPNRPWAINEGGGTEIQYHIQLTDGGNEILYGLGFNTNYVPFANEDTPVEYMRPFIEAFLKREYEIKRLLPDYSFVIGDRKRLAEFENHAYTLFGKMIPLGFRKDEYLLEEADFQKMIEDLKQQLKVYIIIFEERNNPSQVNPEDRITSGLLQDHFYTSTPEGETGVNRYKRIGTQFHVLKVQTEGSVPLKRYYAKDFQDHFYCINPQQENVGMMKEEQDLGFVFPRQLPYTEDTALTPLFRYHSVDLHDHFYTIEDNREYFEAQGYDFERVECIVPKKPTEFTVPVELWVLGDSLLPLGEENPAMSKGEGGVKSGGGTSGRNSLYEEEEDDEERKRNNGKDKIPFHLDKVVSEDKLGREPIAKVFVDLIKKDIFTDKLQHSFMVHLQGSWGSGKSSFLNFVRKHLNDGDEKWIVIEYNAWQNQHISPPWWTLIDQIYRQSQKQLGPFDRCCLWSCENWRRIIRYTGWQKAISFLLTIGLSILLIWNGTAILEFIAESSISSTHTNNTENGITLAVFAKLLITLGAAVGVIYSFSKFISTPFFLNSSHEAVSFVSRATDPMTHIKEHFNGLVDNINSSGKEKRQLTVFIDDIDRCNREFIVQLLEGIQTLFKEKRVLYIVAGEKQWITTSFANKYKEFAHEDQGHRELGELFLEKAFQLSFRMPTVSPKARKQYWNHIIGVEEQEETVKKTALELNDSEKQQIRQAIAESKVDIGSTEFLAKLEENFGVSPDVASNLVLDEKNKDKEEISHLLVGFHDVINQNPRSIIRLANAYTIMRSTIIVERKNISGSKIFRWLIVDDLLPNIKTAVSSFHSERDVANYVSENASDEKIRKDCLALLSDEKGTYDGALTLDDIKSIVEA